MRDENIIQLYFERDERAIRETDRKYGAYCYQVAKNILQNREDSEECVNDTIIIFDAYLNALSSCNIYLQSGKMSVKAQGVWKCLNRIISCG